MEVGDSPLKDGKRIDAPAVYKEDSRMKVPNRPTGPEKEQSFMTCYVPIAHNLIHDLPYGVIQHHSQIRNRVLIACTFALLLCFDSVPVAPGFYS